MAAAVVVGVDAGWREHAFGIVVLGIAAAHGRYVYLAMHHRLSVPTLKQLDKPLWEEIMPYGWLAPRLGWFVWGDGRHWPGDEVAEVRVFVKSIMLCTLLCALGGMAGGLAIVVTASLLAG